MGKAVEGPIHILLWAWMLLSLEGVPLIIPEFTLDPIGNKFAIYGLMTVLLFNYSRTLMDLFRWAMGPANRQVSKWITAFKNGRRAL